MAKSFDLAVWTSASPDYAREIVTNLFPAEVPLLFFWSAERCTWRFDRDIGKLTSIKDLKKVTRRWKYQLERILMLDDSPEKVQRQYANHIPIPSYEGDPADDALLRLAAWLPSLATADNVRRIEKRGWWR